MSVVMLSLGSVLAVSLVPLVAILLSLLREEQLRRSVLYLVSFSTGGLLGNVFIHILPEMAEKGTAQFSRGLLVLLGGMVFSFAVEKVIHWRHCHVLPSEEHDRTHTHPAGVLSLIGDGIHNFIDGMVIAAAFLVGVPLGVSTALAVLFHEIPQELGDFAVLVHSGFGKQRALMWNLLSGAVAFLGAVLVLMTSAASTGLPSFLLPFAAGNFLYLAGSDLIPELHKEARADRAILQILCMVAGIVVMGVIAQREESFPVSLEAPQTVVSTAAPVGEEVEEELFALLHENIVSGGPPKDGIPAIDQPLMTSAEEADLWLQPEDIVFGVSKGDFIVAFPQRILVWHEIVNIDVGGERLSVTYCPLTGTAIGYKGTIGSGEGTTFGVSGKLVNSNLIMYDRATDSYWPQILGRAISGFAQGQLLSEFPVAWTTWERWKDRYPETQVLSRSTGFLRDYGPSGDPYGSYLADDQGYYVSDHVIFPLIAEDDLLPPKTVVVGIRDGEGNAAAIRKDRLRREGEVRVPLGGRSIIITYDADLDFYAAHDAETGEWINAFDAFFFAWYAFFPETHVYL